MDFFLQNVRKNSVTIIYDSSADSFAITAPENIEDVKNIKNIFSKRNFIEHEESIDSEDDHANNTMEAYSVRLVERSYIYLLQQVDVLCEKRFKEFKSLLELSPETQSYKENDFKSDNLIEMLEFRRFLTRYLHVADNSEYKDITYYSLFLE